MCIYKSLIRNIMCYMVINFLLKINPTNQASLVSCSFFLISFSKHEEISKTNLYFLTPFHNMINIWWILKALKVISTIMLSKIYWHNHLFHPTPWQPLSKYIQLMTINCIQAWFIVQKFDKCIIVFKK